MARFDIFFNPNPAAAHGLYVDVQSDFVRLSTRWYIPMHRHVESQPIIYGVHALIAIGQDSYVLDTANLLAVPASLLRRYAGRLSPVDRLRAESCIEFMLRGY